MGDISGKRIMLITSQVSMIVSGIENKLNELGFQVSVVGDDNTDLSSFTFPADVFLYYLPTDALDDPEGMKKHDFVRIIDTAKDKKLILIGENRNYNSYLKAAPAIGDKVWIDRPVDFSVLEGYINALLQLKEEQHAERRILIVDDDPAYAKMVSGWIKDQYTVNIVTAGMHALKFLIKNKVDLILLDYEMPVVDGPQVLEMIRSDPDLMNIPVVFLTGISSRESIERVLSLKPAGYILKNTTREDLLNTLRGLFAKI
ncbi:MAG: response regulator [Lachnospiraceae bacterium]|nr:response regulator [Lachnospiraceae bacterium]